MIDYRIERSISVEEFKAVLVNSTLGARRPVDDDATLSKMIEQADLLITAREEGILSIAPTSRIWPWTNGISAWASARN